MKWKHACTLCGSRDWPSTTTDCPLCYEPPENMPEPDTSQEYDKDTEELEP